jgi:hypothetical protein
MKGFDGNHREVYTEQSSVEIFFMIKIFLDEGKHMNERCKFLICFFASHPLLFVQKRLSLCVIIVSCWVADFNSTNEKEEREKESF